MKVLFYTPFFFPDARGATYSAHRLARALRERGVHVEYIVDHADGCWKERGTYDGFAVRSFSFHHAGKLGKLASLYALTRYVRQHGPWDVVHVHGGDYVNVVLAWWLQIITGAPAILKIASDGWDTPDAIQGGPHGTFVWKLYRRLAGVIAMTSGQAQKCREYGCRGKVAVIGNGVNTRVFRPVTNETKKALRRARELPENAAILVYAGWLSEVKGSDLLFKIWKELTLQHPQLHLLCVGNIAKALSTDEQLRAFLVKHGLEADLAADDRIHIVKRVQKVAEYLQAGDVFVFPSRREGFGTVQVEAMACGLPCVVNDLPGVTADIFPGEDVGIRISNNNFRQYVQSIEALLKDPTRRLEMGRAARSFVEKNFSIRIICEKVLTFYNEVQKRTR